MNAQKMDRRVIRTREALRTALLALISEKDYEEITVEEITERANVGRATFYLHYKAKEDLLLEEFHEISGKKALELAQTPLTAWLGSLIGNKGNSTPLHQIFQHIYTNAEFYKLLLHNSQSGQVIERVQQLSKEATLIFIHKLIDSGHIEIKEDVSLDFFAAFFSGSLTSTVAWWLEKDLQLTPEEMTKMFRRLIFGGVRDSLNIKIF
jgi:AcrR family transcriptional regulator